MAQTNANMELGLPERIDSTNQTNINWSEALRLTEQRLQSIQNIHNNLPSKETAFLEQERDFLQQSDAFLANLQQVMNQFNEDERQNIQRIRAEIESQAPQAKQSRAEIAQVQEAINGIKARIAAANDAVEAANQNKRGIVDRIKPAELAKISFKDFQDESNNIFKWVLQVVYKEAQTSYSWKNFKQQVFVKDKGVDFVDRIRGLGLAKLKKDDFSFGETVAEKKEAFLKDLEPKGKQNPSLRALIEYIELVNGAGRQLDEAEKAQAELDEQRKLAAHKEVESNKTEFVIKMLEDKVRASETYITKVESTLPQFNRLRNSVSERLNIQGQYLQGIQGDQQALNELASNVQVRNTEVIERQPVEIQQSEQIEVEQTETRNAPINTAQGEEQEEEGLGGAQVEGGNRGAKVETKFTVPATDLKESEFAQNKKGSCESCSIF